MDVALWSLFVEKDGQPTLLGFAVMIILIALWGHH